ncbi:ABC transporter permease [Phytohabitans sp. LJ34]|uniref:ABC transporter permease n=1 Tax=Phytohabitans sp. LJ34 TaxID=3452217 RepID=UPI003F8B1B14
MLAARFRARRWRRHCPAYRSHSGAPATWQIAGIVEEGDTTGGGVYTTPDGLAAATGQPTQVNRIRLITTQHDEPTRDTIATTVDRTLTAAGLDVENASSVSRTDAASAGHMGPVLLVLLGIALPLGSIGGIGLASTMSANILDRTREFGIMHAIGAPPKAVRRIVTTEGVLLALTSCAVAILPTLALTAILGDGLGNLFGNAPLPYRISPLAVGIWTALAILGAILATETAATRASRITVREALTSDDLVPRRCSTDAPRCCGNGEGWPVVPGPGWLRRRHRSHWAAPRAIPYRS